MNIRLSLASLLLLAFTIPSHATVFDIVAVETGSGGFGASLFHDTTCGLMCGNNVGRVSAANDGTVLGSYNDLTGAFSGTFNLNQAGGPWVSLVGNLSFDPVTGLMDAVSFLTVTFGGTDLSGGDNLMAFTEGWQCCGNDGFDPNSFKFDHGSADGSHVMTLWGANGWDDGFSDASLLGVDLRFRLVSSPSGGTIPEPGALALVLAGLYGVKRSSAGRRSHYS